MIRVETFRTLDNHLLRHRARGTAFSFTKRREDRDCCPAQLSPSGTPPAP